MTKEEFFARYTFDRTADRLGAGSFGTVFRAYDTVLDGWVALKLSAVTASGMRLSREVELVRSLPEHQNVASYVECHTFNDVQGSFDVAVLRYYDEGSLADLLSAGKFPAEQTDAVLEQILEGLRFLHSNCRVHRGLKPGNILIARRPDGRIVPKITDFGISKQLAGADDTVAAALTVAYASPEQLRGFPVGSNSDLWSFGVIAYRLLTGRMPFTAGDLDPNSMAGRAEITRRITSGELPADVGSLREPWRGIVNACLVVDPLMRTADEARMLAAIGRGMPKPRLEVSVPDVAELRAEAGLTGGDSDNDGTEVMGPRNVPPTVGGTTKPDSTGNLVLRTVIVLALVFGIYMVWFIYTGFIDAKTDTRKLAMASPVQELRYDPVPEAVEPTEDVAVGADTASYVTERGKTHSTIAADSLENVADERTYEPADSFFD